MTIRYRLRNGETIKPDEPGIYFEQEPGVRMEPCKITESGSVWWFGNEVEGELFSLPPLTRWWGPVEEPDLSSEQWTGG
jgi:hypothetical protein